MLNTQQLLDIQEKRKRGLSNGMWSFRFCLRICAAQKQCEQVSLCCWTICPIINLCECLRVSPSSTACSDRKTSRQRLRRARQSHCAATDQLCDHACNDFDDWHPNIILLREFSWSNDSSNPRCMAQSPLPLYNTSHRINEAHRQGGGPPRSEWTVAVIIYITPLLVMNQWYWQRITNSFWVTFVSVSLCYITNHPTTQWL